MITTTTPTTAKSSARLQAHQHFALIDNASGHVWWAGPAASPEDACRRADLETSGEEASYTVVAKLSRNENGYHVHSAPAGFKVDDGEDAYLIEKVAGMPLSCVIKAITLG